MDGTMIMHFFSDFGYIIILPLMIIEGPIATLIAAFMASIDIFNIYVVLLLSMVGDMIGDIIFYGIGRGGGILFVDRFGVYFGISRKTVLRMEKFFVNHGGKTIVSVKATTGLCWATFIAAGIIKMPFYKFVFYSFVGGIVWSGILVTAGYFFGYLYEQIAQYITYAGWIIFTMVIIFFIGMNVIKNQKTKYMFAHVIKKSK